VDEGLWELFHNDGEMKMYKLTQETDDGIVVDPLKAVHSVVGVSAKEYIDLFFDPSLKMEWDGNGSHVECTQLWNLFQRTSSR